MSLLTNEIEKIKKSITNTLPDDRIFSYVILKNFWFEQDQVSDFEDFVTDSKDDGGIDFVYFDDENQRVIIGQSKYTSSLEANTVLAEINKMSSTIENFKKGHTGNYNSKVKTILQNALDRLPDDSTENIDYYIYTSSTINEQNIYKKIKNNIDERIYDRINLVSVESIERKIEENITEIQTVNYEKMKIDNANNCLRYETEKTKGVLVNLSSISLISLYNKYAAKGLFDLNIRKYINNTLDKDRPEFWFLNNGIIIACDSFDIDGNTINLEKFSIVNGGQTTYLIGNYKGANSNEFFIPCKIVCSKDPKYTLQFYSKIAEATNSQKPIFQRDIKSNSNEMKRLQTMLDDNNIYLEIKRGKITSKKKYEYKIKNDELAQLIMSFVYQKPGTARSGKKEIFENPAYYNQIFMQNYDKDPDRKQFIIDLIKMNYRYIQLSNKIIEGLDPGEKEVFKNAKQMLFGILGALYRIINSDLTPQNLINDISIIRSQTFVYDSFISNYCADDLDEKFINLITIIVQCLTENYIECANRNECSSVSNFFKTDKKYQENILLNFIKDFDRKKTTQREINENAIFLKR
ncbi:AIPR family protein [Treponema denticola]|uniref:AIPR family protein n=1 Tax=Treponema denticola TaxID=158 RepID=UPI00210216D0|nr:AIPR family protein [Treponema denticola]UTY23702.1 hypothetical protein E4N78_05845 [Treponema denticola]